MEILKIFFSCYKNYKGVLLFIIAGSLIASLLDLFLPMGIRYILNELLPIGDIKSILYCAAILFLLYLLSFFLSSAVFARGRAMGAGIEYDLRLKLFRHVLNMKFSYFDNVVTGRLLSRLVSDIAEIGELMFTIPHLLIVCIITMLGTILMLFYINPWLASVVSLLLIFKAYEAVVINKRMKASFSDTRAKTADITACISESLAAIRLVKAFKGEGEELKKLCSSGAQLLDVQRKTFKIVGRMNASLSFFSNTTNLVIIVLGGVLTAKNAMNLSDLIAFLLYMMLFMKPVFQLTLLTEVYQRGMAGFSRYLELMREKAEVDSAAKKKPMPCGKIEFQNVSFAYENGKSVLKNFNLTIKAGEITAIVGPTGSGKSTLCQLLLRFYEPTSGRILIDGIDIREYSLDQLRGFIGIMQQDVFLFSGSVKENIAYGAPTADLAAVENAAALAKADKFIAALPQKYDTNIGERGVKLSGGQKQRLAIARIFLKNPPILILDEATSALDNETEKQVQRALDTLSNARTTLIIAHRLAAIRQADKIIVLGKGEIVESGTHSELMNNKNLYYQLYMTQFANEKTNPQ